LHDRDSNKPVVSEGAIVLDCNVELVEANGILVADHTKMIDIVYIKEYVL
jgi:hypothetical protein